MNVSTHRWSGRRRTTSLVAVGALSIAAALAPQAWATAPLAASPSVSQLRALRQAPVLAARIDTPARVKQLITVSASRWSSTTATLKAWQRGADGDWALVRGPVRVVIGYNGWVRASQRRQSTGTTPAGKFWLPSAFGRLPDPGTRMLFRHFDRNDWWPYEPRDPATYNVYQHHRAATSHWRPDNAERLWDYYDQYAYGMVVGFNLPSGIHYSAQRKQRVADRRADTSRGGGIFLHVRGQGTTAGCVAMPRDQMRWLLRWARPRAHPWIAMGPHDYLVRL